MGNLIYFISIDFIKHTFGILLLSTILLLSSCKEEAYKPTYKHDTSNEHIYMLSTLQSESPIDLNFDGIENIDLTKELPDFENSGIVIDTKEDGYISLFWLEPRVNNGLLLVPLPPVLEKGMPLEYHSVSRRHSYSFSRKNMEISIGNQHLNQDKVYTLQMPKSMYMADKGKTITFKTIQTFYNNEGHANSVILHATFSKKEK